MTILSSKAMLASLNITQWTARKLDKRVTAQTNADHNAASDAGRYNKALIASSALAKLVSAGNVARTIHYEKTLPWLDSGARILPAALYQDYTNAMRQARETFETAAAEFIADYPAFVADARIRLNGMFNASDYPDSNEIRRRFSFSTNLFPVPNASDFRVDISEAQAAMIRADIETKGNEALDAAVKDAWQRIADVVGHMAAKLREFKPAKDGTKTAGIFRDSLVDNVRDLVAILPAFNITNDPKLADVAKRMADLCTNDA